MGEADTNMSAMPFRWPVRVYYHDTDAGGVVYHASYLNFYEHARTELLRRSQISQQTLAQQQILFVVKSITVNYFAPAYLDDLLTVETVLASATATSMTYKQQIMNACNKKINACEVKMVCINAQRMKPQAIPNNIVTELTHWPK